MRLKLIFLVAVTVGLLLHAEVEVLSAGQDPISRLVRVEYQLSGEDSIITLSATTNGVPVDDGAMAHVSGDVNRLVTADDNVKVICWRALADIPPFESDALSVAIRVWTKDHPPKYAVVDLRDGIPTDARVAYYASAGVLPHGGLTNDIYRTGKLALVLIPAAGNTFVQGSPTTEADRVEGSQREAQRLVSFENDFYMGVFPVTQEQHRRVHGSVPTGQKTNNSLAPVALVKYNDLRGATSSNPKINWPTTGHSVLTTSVLGEWRDKTGIDFDLPTSAQWEYACRAGCGDTWYWGGNHTVAGDDYDKIKGYAWCGNNCTVPQRVGEKGANAFGLYDMIGNVWEGCLDWGDAIDLPNPGTALVEPPGSSTGTTRLWRGGPYSQGAASLRAAKLNPRDPSKADVTDGYRLVCSPSFKW